MKFFGIILFFIIPFMSQASQLDSLIDALVKVESKGDVNAIGDNGKAVGCLQIWCDVIEDVNRFSMVQYTYDDRYDYVKSKEICRKYLLHYGGRNASNETYARIWNGGPKGHTKISTKKYWNKVKVYLG